MSEFISNFGVWVVAAFIALETMGAPLPAEAALIAAGILARTHGLDIQWLIVDGIIAAVLGNIGGFWIGRRFGQALLTRYGARVGLTPARIRIGQWLFERYGARFVFVARFLPFLRNMTAVLAGTNAMAPHVFQAVSATAAVVWVTGYGLAAYWLGAVFTKFASPAAIVLAVLAMLIVLAIPTLIVRYESSVLAKIDREARQPAKGA